MGTEKAIAPHVACGLQMAAGKSRRQRGGRARRTKERRGPANHVIASIVVPAIDAINWPPLPSEATRSAKDAHIVCPLPCESRPQEQVPAANKTMETECIVQERLEDIQDADTIDDADDEAWLRAHNQRSTMKLHWTPAPATATCATQTPPVRARSSSCADLLLVSSTSPEEASEASAPPRPKLRRGRTWPLTVDFDNDANSIHHITPYAEVYGMHPRLFDFDKDFSMVPAQGFGAAREVLMVVAAEMAARKARGEDPTTAVDDNEDAGSEDDDDDFNFSDDEPCTEYHLSPPHRDAAHIVAAC